MVRRVGLLSTLLHEASARRPAEVLIETDRPVRMRLLDGSSAELAETIGGTAISDELSDLLSTEQQVDLALGEPVKFDLVVGPYTWHLVGETASEVVSVRACPQGELLDASDSVQIPIEPDEMDPLDALEHIDVSDPLDLSSLDMPSLDLPSLDLPSRGMASLDVNSLDVASLDIPRIRRAPPSGPSEIDIDINFDDDAAAQSGQLAEERPATGLRLAALRPVPPDSKPQPGWPRPLVARADVKPEPRAATRSDSPRNDSPRSDSPRNDSPRSDSPRNDPPRNDPPRNDAARPDPTRAGWPREGRRRGGAQPASAAAVPTRQLPLQPGPRREDMAELLTAFEPGSLALLLRASGHAESVAQALGLPTLAIGDADTREQATGRLGELGEGGLLIVRAEDPSPWLPWLLRRIEEGRRAIVETDARTPAGARRILLGVGAPARAEQWLDAVRVLSATVEDGRWTLLSPGT